MANGADDCHARLLPQLFDSIGACRINAEHRQDSDYVHALSFYCGFHDICLDPVTKMFVCRTR
jgi:hypothetical protein